MGDNEWSMEVRCNIDRKTVMILSCTANFKNQEFFQKSVELLAGYPPAQRTLGAPIKAKNIDIGNWTKNYTDGLKAQVLNKASYLHLLLCWVTIDWTVFFLLWKVWSSSQRFSWVRSLVFLGQSGTAWWQVNFAEYYLNDGICQNIFTLSVIYFVLRACFSWNIDRMDIELNDQRWTFYRAPTSEENTAAESSATDSAPKAKESSLGPLRYINK